MCFPTKLKLKSELEARLLQDYLIFTTSFSLNSIVHFPTFINMAQDPAAGGAAKAIKRLEKVIDDYILSPFGILIVHENIEIIESRIEIFNHTMIV